MRRTSLLIAGVAAGVILSKVLVEDVLGMDLSRQVVAWTEHRGTGSAVAIVAILAVDVFLPVPSSFVMILSGAMFGTLVGSALSFVGSVGGNWLGFELARRYGRATSRRLVGERELGQLERLYERHGAPIVVISRALPILMESMSVVAGLARMGRGAFLMASLAGTAPVAIAYGYAGSVSREVGSLVPAGVMLLAVTAAAFLWYRDFTRSHAR